MTYIRKLEMKGFKSSGPRSVVVNFEKGFTVITGPNGSGKSNIADAIMFALGENSPKQLRAANGRLTGLIYDPKKEEEAPALQKPSSCRVTITFDNADRAIPLDSDTVTVTRELRDDGENVYYLNGRKTTRSTLTEILDLAGLSPGGLNIIPQGAATRVADLTPEEKRRMIEEVVGISKFDERKAEAQRQLSQADQRLEVAMARIGEMKSTLDSLDSQRNDMVRFNLLEEQINWLKAVRTSRRIGELRQRVSALSGMAQEMESRLQELNSRVSELEGKISQVEAERTKFIVDVVQGGGASHVELQFQLAQVDNELQALEEDFRDSQQSLASLENEQIPSLKQIVATKEKEVNQSSATVRQLTAELEKLDGRYSELSSKLELLTEAEEELRETIDKRGKQVARVQAKLADVSQKLNGVEISINGVAASLSAEKKRLEELKLRVDGYAEVLNKLDSNTKSLFELYEGSTKELSSLDSNLSEIEKRRELLLASIDEASRILEKATAEVSKEEAFRQMSESLAGERTGQAKLQEFCESGGVPGYVGRLSHLVSYPQAYSRAVNAVLGRWLGAFIVEDLRAMTQLIKAAKRLRAKAFSVIPLSEVDGTEAVDVESSAGVIGPLSTVLKADKKYTGLLNFLAGDTVLVETEAVGFILASEGMKSVTLDGETFEPGGRAFSYGYQEIVLNIMEGLENIEGISEIEEAVGALKGAIQKRRSQLQAIEQDSRSLMKDRVKKIVTVASLKAEATTISRMSSRYRSIFRSMNVQYMRQAKVVERLEKRLASFTAERDELNNEAKSLQEFIAATNSLGLDSMLAEIIASKQELSSEMENLRTRIADVNLSLSREKGNLENVLMRTLEENRLDLESALEDYQSTKEFVREAPRRIRELTEQKQALESQIEKLKESSRKSQPVLDEFERRLKKLKEERDSAVRAASNAERELFSLRSQVESAREKVEEALGSLRMLGFSQELEVFESSEELLSLLESEYQEVVTSVNRGADRQYREMYTNYKSLSVRHNELEKERNAIISFIESVEREKRKVFISAFEKISAEFKAIFSRLTSGEAWLELENPDDIFSGGLMLMARFGAKPAWESVSLSGGEKAVCGVSLILAMQGVQPHPFYLFDEIDSALDAVNSGNLAEFFRERAGQAQIIAITLRDVFIARSDMTYGVYAAGGISHVVHYKPAEVAANRG